MKKNKYLYIFVIQGNYGQGWEDLCEYEKIKNAWADIKEYRFAESSYANHRIINRRVLND